MITVFFKVTSFNQPLNGWNVASVTNRLNIFQDATSFNKPMDGWNVISVTFVQSVQWGIKLQSNSLPMGSTSIFSMSTSIFSIWEPYTNNVQELRIRNQIQS
jgi:hypothetical protein